MSKTMKFKKPFTAQWMAIILMIWLCHSIDIHWTAGSNRKIVSSSISCYSCDSRNESDINCQDPFNPAMSKYVENCKVPKQNHIGVFPARFCVKVVGKTVESGESLMIRACSLESMDNQCGKFRFEGSLYMGCILTCDYDGCNHANPRGYQHYYDQVAFFIILMRLSLVLILGF